MESGACLNINTRFNGGQVTVAAIVPLHPDVCSLAIDLLAVATERKDSHLGFTHTELPSHLSSTQSSAHPFRDLTIVVDTSRRSLAVLGFHRFGVTAGRLSRCDVRSGH